MKALLFGEKKWWAVLLGGLLNGVAYATIMAEFCLGSMTAAMWLSVIPFALMIIVFNTISLKKLFLSTALYVGAFILVGFPLSRFFYMHQFEILFPGEKPWAGDGFGIMTVTAFYLFIGLVAWIIALVSTSLRASKKKNSA